MSKKIVIFCCPSCETEMVISGRSTGKGPVLNQGSGDEYVEYVEEVQVPSKKGRFLK